MTHTRDILDLTNGELCVLRWLRISNSKATISAGAVAANSLSIVPDRLLNAGYVRTRTDQFSPKTVHYTLTESGLEALEVHERRTFFSDLAKQRRAGPATAVRPSAFRGVQTARWASSADRTTME